MSAVTSVCSPSPDLGHARSRSNRIGTSVPPCVLPGLVQPAPCGPREAPGAFTSSAPMQVLSCVQQHILQLLYAHGCDNLFVCVQSMTAGCRAVEGQNQSSTLERGRTEECAGSTASKWPGRDTQILGTLASHPPLGYELVQGALV